MDLINNDSKYILNNPCQNDIDERWRYPRFFINDSGNKGANYTDTTSINDNILLTGNNACHAVTVLRLKKGDFAVICDGQGMDYLVRLNNSGTDNVEFKIIKSKPNNAEPDIYVRLFQCVPKSDKMEVIIQKATELGVSEIIPVISKRCVSRPDDKSKNKKMERFQKIAEEAAKQSGRGIIPKIGDFTKFNDAVTLYKKTSLGIILYECGGLNINEIMKNLKQNPNTSLKNIDVFIGSEGGFEEYEIDFSENVGINKVYLGNRVLRTETAPIVILSILMNLTGNL